VELERALDGLLCGLPSAVLAAYVRVVTASDGAAAAAGKATRPWETRCAKCGGFLVGAMSAGGAILDRCVDCHGVWLDPHELVRILGGVAHLTDEGGVFQRPAPPADLDGVRGDCPRCHLPLRRHPIRGPSPMTVEQCRACRGLWFDAGELEQLVSGDVVAAVRQLGALGI
jgi:Zn-finger nucleic acid-binding protein